MLNLGTSVAPVTESVAANPAEPQLLAASGAFLRHRLQLGDEAVPDRARISGDGRRADRAGCFTINQRALSPDPDPVPFFAVVSQESRDLGDGVERGGIKHEQRDPKPRSS